jgi:hypothetical protein
MPTLALARILAVLRVSITKNLAPAFFRAALLLRGKGITRNCASRIRVEQSSRHGELLREAGSAL